MIKYISKTVLMLFAAIAVFTGCSDSDKEGALNFAFSLSKDNITTGAEGGNDSFVVQAVGAWSIVSAPDWVTISPVNGVGTVVCNVKVHSSSQNDLRSENIRIRSGVEELLLTINQTGFDRTITPKTPEVSIKSLDEFEKRYFEVEVVTNVEFDVTYNYLSPAEGWLTLNKDKDIDFGKGARPRTIKMRFDWEMNAEPEERVAEICFVPRNADEPISEPAVITVTQEAAVRIDDSRAGDSIALLTIYELINSYIDNWDTSERLDNWSGVTLWEATDESLPCPEAIGRVRSVVYTNFKTKEPFPEQIKHLKYLEDLSIKSNENAMLLSLELSPEICRLEYLKSLYVYSYGLVSLPEEFKELGNTLEYLDLSANNFNEIPAVLTEKNFPKLKTLYLVDTRRWDGIRDLRKKDDYDDGIGLNIKSSASSANQLRELFLWENLELLALSYCCLEGQLPDFKVGEDGVVAYTQSDVDKFGGDTIQWLADNNMPKILPNMKSLRLNLNFLTGKIPEWMLYHPRFLEWFPDALIFEQEELATDSEGNSVGFDEPPTDFEYYYEAFPKMRAKFEIKEEYGEEEE